MQTSFARYFHYRKIDMFFALLKTRYDINLVAERQHIECTSTYRVCKTYRKSRKRFISMKKRLVETSRFFWSGRRDSNSRRSPWQGDALPLSHSRIFSFPNEQLVLYQQICHLSIVNFNFLKFIAQISI